MIDLTTRVLDAYGQPFKHGTPNGGDPAGKDLPDLTVGRVIIEALGSQLPEEGNLGIDQKFARGVLALKISESNEIELTPAQITTIKRLVGRMYFPVIVARVLPLIDPTMSNPVELA